MTAYRQRQQLARNGSRLTCLQEQLARKGSPLARAACSMQIQHAQWGCNPLKASVARSKQVRLAQCKCSLLTDGATHSARTDGAKLAQTGCSSHKWSAARADRVQQAWIEVQLTQSVVRTDWLQLTQMECTLQRWSAVCTDWVAARTKEMQLA